MDPNPDQLVGGMDPRIRIQIHTKISWIRNTGFNQISKSPRKSTNGEIYTEINIKPWHTNIFLTRFLQKIFWDKVPEHQISR